MNAQRYIVEIRYLPDPSFLDKRGSIAKQITSEEFKDWLILENTIELRNDSGKMFITYERVGFSTTDTDLEKYINKLEQILKILGDLPPVRWGVRAYLVSPSKKQFSNLLNQYQGKYLKVNEQFSALGGELKDVGVSYVFEKDHNSYHLTIGPMNDEQATLLFPKQKIGKSNNFLDIDIYRENDQFYGADYRASRIIDFVKAEIIEIQNISKELFESINE